MEGVDLGGAVLRLYGDRSALDRELEKLRRYTEALERKGIKVRFDADTGKAVQEVDKLHNRLDGVNRVLQDLAKATRGDWSGLINGMESTGKAGDAAAAGVGKAGTAVTGLVGAASKAIPVLGQLYLAGQGIKMIFNGVSAAIMGTIHKIEGLTHEAGRFNQQVATGSIFAAQAFSIFGPDGKAIEGTANQMRALRGVMTNEYQRIHEEVSKINGATSAQVMESFNIIMQHSQALGTAANDLSNITDMAVAATAALNVLGVGKHRTTSEVTSLLLGDVQPYNTLARDLRYTPERVKREQEEGTYYQNVMKELNTLVDGQRVLSESLENVKSNWQDTFEVINSQGYQALERGLAGALMSVWKQFDGLRGSFIEFIDGFSAFVEPILRLLGQVAAAFVPIIAALAAISGAVMQLLGVVANMINAALSGPLEILVGLLGFIATVIQQMVDRSARLFRALSAVFAVFAGGETDQVRTFFADLNDWVKDAIKWFDQWLDIIVKGLGLLTEWNARRQASRATVRDSETGEFRRLTDEEIEQRVKQARDDYNRRTNWNPDARLENTNASRRYRQMSDELRDRYLENPELTIAQEVADVRQRTIENDIRGLQNGLRLLEAQRSVMQAMAELAAGNRQIEMAQAGFAVQLSSSPEARLEMERQQRELQAQQSRQELQERRELLGQERLIQDRQAQIQDRQAEIQVVQLEIANLEAQIQRDRAQQMLAEANRLVGLAVGHKRDEYVEDKDRWEKELLLRNQILEQTQRALALGHGARSVAAEVAATEQQVLSIREQQLGVQLEQLELTREQQQVLEQIQEEENALNRRREDSRREMERQKAELEALLTTEQRSVRVLDEQGKLRKAQADLAAAEEERARTAAERSLRVAELQDRANSGGSIRDILAARIEAAVAGEAGMVSVADATRRLYEARERQMEQEHDLARQQQELQHQREQSELRIASLRLRVQRLDLQTSLEREQIALQQAQINQRRDNLAAQVVPGSGQTPAWGAGGARFGRTGSMDLAEGYGMVDIRGGNRSAVRDDALDVIAAARQRGDTVWIGGDKSGDVEATKLTGEDLIRAVERGIDRHANRVRPDEYAIDLIARLGTEVGIPLGNVGNRGGGNGWGGDTRRGNWAIHLTEDSASSTARPPAAAPPAAGGGADDNWRRFGMYLAGLETDHRPRRNPRSGADGFFQFTEPTLQDAESKYGVPRSQLLSSNFDVAMPAWRKFVEQDAPGAAQRIAAGQFYEAMPLVNWRHNRWPTLPGFDQHNPEKHRLYAHHLEGGAVPAAPAPGTPAGWSQAMLAATAREDARLDLPIGTTAAGQMSTANGATYSPEDLRAIATAVAQAMLAEQNGQAAPATASEQAVLASQQNINLLQQRLGLLDEENELMQRFEENAQERMRLEKETLAASQANARNNLRTDFLRDQVFAEILGGPDARLAADMAETMGGFFSNAVRTGLVSARQQGELDVQAFFEGVLGSMADRVIDSLVSYALAPIDKVLKTFIFEGLTGLNVEEVAANVQAAAAERQAATAAALGEVASKYAAATERFDAAVTRFSSIGAAPGDEPPGSAPSPDQPPGPPDAGEAAEPVALNVLPYSGASSPGAQGPAADVSTELAETVQGVQQLNTAIPDLTDATAEAGASLKEGSEKADQGFGDLQKNLGTVVGTLAGIGMIAGGASMIGKGGTYNTLMGLAGIFGGIGSLASTFGNLSKRSRGGAGQAGRTLLVGEQGPELFTPDANGQITAHEQTRAYLEAQASLATRLKEDSVATPDGSAAMIRGRRSIAAADSNQALGDAVAGLFDASRDVMRSSETYSKTRELERITETTAVKALQPLKLQYESTVINQVEYVTADQFQRGMASAAQQGRALAIKQLGNSNQTRKRLGIS